MMVQVITIEASRECLPPEAFCHYNLEVFIYLLFAFAAHAVFVVVVDYGLEHYVALDVIISGCRCS